MISNCLSNNSSFSAIMEADPHKSTLLSVRSLSQRQLNHPPSNCFFALRKSHSPFRISCHRESKAIVVTSKSWDQMVLNSEIPVLVEFHASWCGPCKMVHRIIDEIAVEYNGRLKCCIIHADNDVTVADNYNVKAVPVVLLFKNAEKCETVIGTMPKEFYTAAIERVLSS